MNEKRTVGTKYLTYAEKRNITLPFKNYEVKKTLDLLFFFRSSLLILINNTPIIYLM